MHPINVIVDWFLDSPPQIRGHLAALVLAMFPGYDRDRLETHDSITEFQSFLEDTPKDPARTLGKVIALRALITHILSDITREEFWESRRAMLHWELLHTAGIKQGLEEELRGNPEEAAAWIRIGAAWKKLCYGELSDSELRRWAKAGGE